MCTATANVVKMEIVSSVPSRLEDFVGFYGDPFVALQDDEDKPLEINKNREGKEPFWDCHSDENTVEAADEVNWTKYNPPAALKTAPNVTNAVLLEILQTSIGNVQARGDEDNQRREEEEKRREADTTVDQGGSSSISLMNAPYLPIIMTTGDPESSTCQPSEDNHNLKLFPELMGNSEGRSATGLIVLPFQPKKKSRFALARILQKIGEKEATRRPFRLGGNSSRMSMEGPLEDGSASSKSKKIHAIECVSCLDDFNSKDMVRVTCHSYCRECFERLITTAVQNEQQWPPKCCLNDIPFRTILRYVPKDLGRTYKDRAAEWKIPVSQRIYCNQPDCGLWVRPDHVNQGLCIARCSNAHWTCTTCRGPQHENSDCPQDRDLALTKALAADEGWQHCSKCQALVEHREACQHMTCRCGYEFCYVCNQKWRTCTCTMDQLNTIKAGAATRRQERQRREAEVESELQDALRQIEEFEREEALKAELLRQDMERQEEERRQRELEERVRLESLRRHEIEVKYQRLREMLDQTHDMQEVLVRYQHDKEKELASREASTSTTELEAKQQAEYLELTEMAARKLATKEQALATEYILRAIEEKKTEDAYLQVLKGFFAGKPASEARVEELIRELRMKMDKGWRAWLRWRKEEAEGYKMKVEEERTIREEIMYSVKKRHEESVEEGRRELEKRQAAELRWLTLVVAERVQLLARMETAEVEDGADGYSTPTSTTCREVSTMAGLPLNMTEQAHARWVNQQKADKLNFIKDVSYWLKLSLVASTLQIILFVSVAIMAPSEDHGLEDWLTLARGFRITAVMFYEIPFVYGKTMWFSICLQHRLSSHAIEFGSTMSLVQQFVLIWVVEPTMIQVWRAHQAEEPLLGQSTGALLATFVFVTAIVAMRKMVQRLRFLSELAVSLE
ncbi:putative E3 ubiquitin-protein ligase ARI9 [Colletotrichum tanaceti]|uniref:RBR-type E3 ubiquitin transferase n=1 Tax=Colletotrichum tanaceti TaxID=1306861 RepID=A0A4U6XC68_9PEZI|nr:putative E3 ubiquitin-protein ligase ARI9 [Colletotrichum tanaceti]TKW51357.1 putative E3 ubiquitin-protein ligase ARI9 [Colletotrichum tanaceti]